MRLRWTMAAAMLVMIGTAALLLSSGRAGVIQTERGERREVALADGSVVQVDPETRLRVKYEEHVRRVYLEHGRAFFHVAKNAERPFLVESNDTAVRAVGTAFAVEQRDNATILVTVAEGKVAIFSTKMLSGEPVPGLLRPPVPSLEETLRQGHPRLRSGRFDPRLPHNGQRDLPPKFS